MYYGINLLSIVPIRAEAKEESEQTTQLLFGETFTVLEEQPKWLKIQTHHDAYKGWIDRKIPTIMGDDEYHTLAGEREYLVDSQIAYLEEDDVHFPIVLGSSLPGFNEKDFTLHINNHTFSFQGLYKLSEPQASGELLVKNAMRFRRAPYLWGGRSVFGVDCSGFMQIVFKMCGFLLPRDSYQQAEKGYKPAPGEQPGAGDLAFFTNSKGKIAHVGMLINPNEIIHVHGNVHVDDFNEKGIINKKTGEHTHKLAEIKRYIKNS